MKVLKFLIILLVFQFLLIFPARAEDNATTANQYEAQKARVLESFTDDKVQTVNVKIIKGNDIGNTVKLTNTLAISPTSPLVLKEGDEVIVYLYKNVSGEITGGYIAEYVREKPLLYLTVIFLMLLIIIGGFKGFKAILTLTITGLAILKLFIPGIFLGFNPTLLTIGVAILITILTLLILNGFTKKTFAAIIGISMGLIISGIISSIFIYILRLSGMDPEQSFLLETLKGDISFNFKGLFFSGIILGALGAVMDVGISIASSLNELIEIDRKLTPRKLLVSGMNVGKDIMGSMCNTLILAYVGSSITAILIYSGYNVPFIEIINKQETASEILRALAGSIGLIFTIPTTVLASMLLFKRKR